MYVIGVSFLKVKMQVRKSGRSLTGRGLVRSGYGGTGEKAPGSEAVRRAEHSPAILET